MKLIKLFIGNIAYGPHKGKWFSLFLSQYVAENVGNMSARSLYNIYSYWIVYVVFIPYALE